MEICIIIKIIILFHIKAFLLFYAQPIEIKSFGIELFLHRRNGAFVKVFNILMYLHTFSSTYFAVIFASISALCLLISSL